MLRLSTTTPAAAFVVALGAAACASADEPAAAPPSATAQAVAEPTFDVEAYDIDGNTLLDELAIEKAVYAHLGPHSTREDVEGARQDLENAYHALGYDSVVVELPPQTVADHIVRLHVIETTVGRLRVTGSRFHSIEDLKQGAPALAEGQTPNFQQAQTEIAELNRDADRQVTPLVRPGRIPGTIDVDLKVTEKEPLHADVELNDDHAADTEPLRLTANVRYDNLWQRGHMLSLSYAVAPQDPAQSQVFAASYLAPAPGRWRILLYGYTSNSNVATLGDTTVLGKGYAAGVRGIAQLPAIGPFTQSLSVGFDFKHFDQLITAQTPSASGGASTSLTYSAIDYVPLNAVYSLRMDTASSSTHASLGATIGLRGGASADANIQVNRAHAYANFVHLNLDLEHTDELPLGMEGDLRLTGQLSDQPLISGEQFAAGGLDSVRGFNQAAATGDNGLFGAIELRSPPITILPRQVIDDWRVFVFGDAAEAWLLQPLADQTSAFSLYSAGVGGRFKLLNHIDGELVEAVPLASAHETTFGRVYTEFSLKAGF